MLSLYLKALEIQGFKSFPEKTVLAFGQDITAIVGPNGSGKSNLADAIRWVLGEQSTRTLRGNKMEDVIFDGTAKRKGLGFAEVSLVLDNGAHLFPMEETEVSITRRYYRSGESEYYINRRSCRLRDIHELLMDTGLGREGYSIIGQGRIDEILSVKSADRREIFEEAAGISRFRHRKEEAERKLQRTEENLVRIRDKIDELELQVEPLRKQAERTRQFLGLQEELKGLEVSVWLEQLEGLRASGIQVSASYETARRHMEQAQQEQERLYGAEESFAHQMREKELEGEGLREKLLQGESKANGLEQTISILHHDRNNNQDNILRIQEELQRQESRAAGIGSQIAERRAHLDKLNRALEQGQQTVADLNRAAEETAKSAGVLTEELEQLGRSAQGREASAGEARQRLSAFMAAAQELLERNEGLLRELEEQGGRLEETRNILNKLTAELALASEQRDGIQSIIADCRMRRQTRSQQVETAQEEYQRVQIKDSNLASRIQMLTEMEQMYEGYSRAVKLVMRAARQGGLSGIHGPVAGLIQVPECYAVAIEVALGSAMQNIVVERDEDGKQAIGWLKRKEGGRATFLPIHTMTSTPFRDTMVEQEPGFVGMGDRLIRFNSHYQRIVSHLLGRVVIAEDMDRAVAIARKFHHRFRIVTLDGQVIHPGGSMTGGSVSRSAGILSRANELKRLRTQKTELEERLLDGTTRLEEARQELISAEQKLDGAVEQLREAESTVLQLQERVAGVRRQLEDMLERERNLRAEQAQLQSRMAEHETAIQTARDRIAALENEAQVLRAEQKAGSEGQSSLQMKLDDIRRTLVEHHTRLAGMEGERAAMEQALAELEGLRAGLTGETQTRLTMVQEFEGRNQDIARQLTQAEETLKAVRTENQVWEESIRQIQAEKLELEGLRNRNSRDLRDKNDELMALSGELSVLENKRTAVELEERQLLDRLWEGYGLSHEAARSQRVELESMARAQRRIGELKRSISALGSINPNAVEEFRRVYERYTYFTDQRDDVTGAKEELEGIISQITGEMTEIFQERFHQINQSFQGIFQELFQGGKATLELDDPKDILNCGIEIRVQPPGKALKVISLLSGGEKAFVAIALYFSILKVRPTPFCVMDEIEAALDEANVIRFAQYLRRMCDKTQFILITHRRGTMEEADILYGVTMQEQGISKILTINLNEVAQELNLK